MDSSALLNAFKKVSRNASRSVDRRKLKRVDEQVDFDSGAMARLDELKERHAAHEHALSLMNRGRCVWHRQLLVS